MQKKQLKKWIKVLTAVAMFGSTGFADSLGFRLGYPLGVQYTFDNTFGTNTGLRIAAGVTPIGGVLISGQVDALLGRVALIPGGGFNAYFGGGVHTFYLSQSVPGFSSATIFTVGLQATGGLEFSFSPSVSAFLEVNPGFEYRSGSGSLSGFGGGSTSGFAFDFGAAIGMNFRL